MAEFKVVPAKDFHSTTSKYSGLIQVRVTNSLSIFEMCKRSVRVAGVEPERAPRKQGLGARSGSTPATHGRESVTLNRPFLNQANIRRTRSLGLPSRASVWSGWCERLQNAINRDIMPGTGVPGYGTTALHTTASANNYNNHHPSPRHRACKPTPFDNRTTKS